MDTSEQYIKMCDCPEVQGQWKPTWGDWYINGDIQLVELEQSISGHIEQEIERYKPEYSPKWLPRQDQIQEMMEGHKKPHYLIISLINFMQDAQIFYKSGRMKKLYPVGSMEQIWLAFYMYEKHKKVWRDNKWCRQ